VSIEVEFVDKMGNDLSVVNAARVSYEVWHDEFEKNDAGLIRYLAKHNHWTPFAHTSITFRIKAPIFVARQLVKHQVGLVWNEVSRRYVDSKIEFYYPDNWRKRGGDSKQGSLQDEFVEYLDLADESLILSDINDIVGDLYDHCEEVYDKLLKAEVCPEQARMVLPLASMTQWIWTGNVASISRVCNLRCAPDTQKETRDVANLLVPHMQEFFPVSWKALRHD
tara:strand:- start:265 stop:933 length:669 start_codon:yes stop_codon:yes gene_type:complete